MTLRITILCSSETHPINQYLFDWMSQNATENEISIARKKSELQGGDILFLISCNEILKQEDLDRYGKALVLHASDLPLGRGWSPHIWQIVDGATEITMSLLEAAEKVDRGDIWMKLKVQVPRGALWNEINHLLFKAELQLMDFAVKAYHTVRPEPQSASITPTYYPKRTPADSRLDPTKSLEEQFDLIRVCDPERFPAFFELHGHTYVIKLERRDEAAD
ncbi:MAG: formyltransferase family protein [Shinella sp.]|uniref:formyltransferase family protein n=1 Tax=Shinella sp. TaxID=1870904 RepID=UPI004036A7C0